MSLVKQVQQDAPAAYWMAQGTTYAELRKDRSGNGRDLSDAGGGAAPVAATGGLVPGLPGYVEWAAASNNAYVADAAWNSLTTAFTLEGWFRFSTVAAQQGLFEKYDPGGGYLLRLSAAGLLNATPLTAAFATDVLASPSALSANRLYHIAYTVAGSTTGRLYVDGVQVATKTHSVSAADGSARLDIGARSGDQTFRFSGRMAHLAVYGSALPADRIAAHYQAGIRGGVVGG